MTLETDLNQAPYFDDFDGDNNYHRILFKPGVAVQARELTQLQTILQNQVERFGDNILTEGTIISGCSINRVRNLSYVKILDDQGNGAPVSMNTYKNNLAVGKTTGIRARVSEVGFGLQAQSPDLNTLFVKYLDSGNNNESTFSATETIEIRDWITNEVIADVVAAGTVEENSIGNTYAVRVGDGIIYQKGFFIRVEEQVSIVDRYSTEPDNLMIGFKTDEELVNSNNDTSLQDNAQGYPNANAPGADRIKLTPRLITVTNEEAEEDESFLAVQEFQSGKVVRRRQDTQYSGILEEMEKRTAEESGDYAVRDFRINVSANTVDSDYLDVNVGAGLAYVLGKRIELLNKIDIPMRKATDSNTEIQQNITTNYGNYVLVNEWLGNISFGYGETVTLHSGALNAATNGILPSYPSGTKIGTARVRAVVQDSADAGTPSTQYRVYLFDIQMDSGRTFDGVRTIYYNGTHKGAADLVLENGRPSIRESNYTKMIFPVGREAIKSIPTATTDYVYRNNVSDLTVSGTTGDLNITLSNANDEFPFGIGELNNTQKREISIIPSQSGTPYVSGVPIDLDNATVEVTSDQSMTVSLPDVPANDMDVTVYYNVKRTNAAPAGKDLETVYVKINPNSHGNGTSGSYSLGLPDVFEIVDIWQGSTYSESEERVTGRFRLYKNTFDSHYGLSRIRKKGGHSISSSDRILVKAKVFKKNTTGSFGDGFFTVDSYPIDDANPDNDSAITTQEIPEYRDTRGDTYDLRDVIDFRPYASATANYATSISGATTNPNETTSFSGNLFIPAPNATMELDYEYYLARIDKLVVSSDGNFILDEGEATENPIPPADSDDGMTLSTFRIPPFPSLPKRTADRAGKPQYGVTLTGGMKKRYTMSEIGSFEKRLERLEYYVTLNSLEQDAVNMLITDDNGSSRFKNGIFADNFSDLRIADVRNGEFSAGIDPTNSEITPRFRAITVNLRSVGGSNYETSEGEQGQAMIADHKIRELTRQPYATASRNCTADFYSYGGVMEVYPSYDAGYDTSRAPDATADLTQAFAKYTDLLSEILPLNMPFNRGGMLGTTKNALLNSVINADARVDKNTLRRIDGVTDSTKVKVGDFVTDINFSPFIRAQRLKVDVNGLRPKTRHYWFFDGKPIGRDLAVADQKGYAITKWERWIQSRRYGEETFSDAKGGARAFLRIPPETFFVGTRKIEIMDVENYKDREDATSYAEFDFHAFNYSVEKSGLSTRNPQFEGEQNISRDENSNFVDVSNSSRYVDPMAQTFFVDPGVVKENAVFVTEFKLYFEQKSSNKGIMAELREVENGIPTKRVVPLSRVHLNASEVVTSSDGRLATTFKLPNPVALRTGREYAIVIRPDGNNPDYRLWISRTGEQEVRTGRRVVTAFGNGVLLTSTNGRTWTPYQKEAAKFRVMWRDHNKSDGYVELADRKNEFFDVNGVSGKFREGERVVQINDFDSGTISIPEGSFNATGSGTSFGSLEVGQEIAVRDDNGELHLFEIETIQNNTSMTFVNSSTESISGDNFFQTVSGVLTYINTRDPQKMVLEESTVKYGRVFNDGDNLEGVESGATAQLDKVADQKISYLQANITRVNTSKTNTSIRAQRLCRENGSYYSSNMTFNDNLYLSNSDTVLKSRSNIKRNNQNGDESFYLRVNMNNNGSGSPVVDIDASNVMIYEYIINNDSNGEEGLEGNADAKYVSMPIELANGMDADDISVFVSGYRPSGTDIKVYVRFQSEYDNRNFEEIEWSELYKKPETNGYSSSANRFDFKEFEFGLSRKSDSNITDGSGAALNKNNENVLRYRDENGVVHDRFKNYAIKVVLLSNRHGRVPRMQDVRAIALS